MSGHFNKTTFMTFQLLLLCHKDGNVDWEEQEADKRVGDPLHDSVLV